MELASSDGKRSVGSVATPRFVSMMTASERTESMKFRFSKSSLTRSVSMMDEDPVHPASEKLEPASWADVPASMALIGMETSQATEPSAQRPPHKAPTRGNVRNTAYILPAVRSWSGLVAPSCRNPGSLSRIVPALSGLMYPEFTVLKVAKIQGIPITLHWSLALIVVLLVFDWGLPGVLAGVLLFGSVLLHELGHALVARHFGLPIRGITLHLLGGAAVMERHPRTPREELLIAAAGPTVSLALGLVGLSVLFASGLAADPFAAGFQALVPYFAFLNLAMGVFNLVPALPMDGGRILRALLSPRLGDLRATRVAARVSRVISAIFLLGGLYAGSWTLPLIGLFVFLLARQEEKQAEFREAQRQLEAWELSEGRAHWVPRASPRLSLICRRTRVGDDDACPGR